MPKGSGRHKKAETIQFLTGLNDLGIFDVYPVPKEQNNCIHNIKFYIDDKRVFSSFTKHGNKYVARLKDKE